MTREEAILCIKGIKNLGHDMFTEQKDFQECLDMAIKALEQEPCKDAVSRQTVSYIIKSHIHEIITESGIDKNAHTNAVLRTIVNLVETMPSVTPTKCIAKVTFDKDELQKIVDEKVKELTVTQKWIPVSERMPENNGRYLVTMKGISNYFYISTTSYAKDLHKVDKYDFKSGIGDGWYNYDEEYGHYKIDNVVAWMPLPEKYKAESEVSE